MRHESHELQAKPLVLVDIDGVISLFGPSSDGRPEVTWLLVDGIPHVLSQAAAAHLHALSDRFEPVWCSGWEEKANEYLPGALRSAPFPFLRFDATRSHVSIHAHWKLAAIEAYAAQRPLAWVDDAFTDACPPGRPPAPRRRCSWRPSPPAA